VIDAVVFDLDGVIVDSEQVWDDVRVQLVHEAGLPFPPEATRAMMGMSSPEWSRYLVDEVGLPGTPEQANAAVVAGMHARYAAGPPFIPGALPALHRIGARWPLAIASSSNRELIDLVLDAGELQSLVRVTVSSEEVDRGKPAPDVYLEATRLLGVEPRHATAVEDSHNGIRSAKAAALRVVAIPNVHFPPDAESLALADVVLSSIDELTVAVVAG
jgi:HAD superfamily hydrolase (TIGR01509 family)